MPRAPRSPTLQAELDRIGAERFDAEQESKRIYRREMVRVCLQCLGSSALGAIIMGYAMHTSDHSVGQIAWWGGQVVGYAGITVALATAYRRGEERGDW